MPSALIPAEHLERSPDVGDPGSVDLLLAEPIRRDERQQKAPMFDENVVELTDEMPGQLLLVGFLGDDGLPRLAEIVDEVREREHERFSEQSGLRPEVAKQQILADSGRLGDFTRRRAPVVLAGEKIASGVQEQSSRLAAGPAGCLDLRLLLGALLLGRTSLGQGCSLLGPRSAADRIHDSGP